MLVKGFGRLLQPFSRNVRRPARTSQPTGIDKDLTTNDLKDYEDSFVPLANPEAAK